MSRKRRYTKNNYYKKRYYSKNNQTIDSITWIILIFLLWLYTIYETFIKPNIESITLFLKIFTPILIIISLMLVFYIYKRKRRIKREEEKNKPNFILGLKNKIKSFTPSQKHKKEELYQMELLWYLKNDYQNAVIEETKSFSRPDITIDDIAIEIKWPTNMSWLQTIPDKINKYLNRWNYLFIVLFDINIVNYKTKEENMKIYEEKKEEILKKLTNETKEKIIFIEI